LTGERVERRLAAVLAADVAGYSRLMGTDEEGTLARLKAVRKALVDPAIASHRGRIVKTTGDGMLVEFASAVDAARCATEVQRDVASQNADVPPDVRIEFRIGIHVGDIIIDDNDIFGDGVNIAARLEGLAEPGGICMSDDTYRQVRGKVEIVCDDLGLQTLKNIVEPMRVWRAQLGGQSAAKAPQVSSASQTPALTLSDKPSIAVLPFQNMSGDPEQEYFADGIVEDIITALPRFKSLFVIARNSSFTYKGKAVDIKQVGRELGVRYILEGSVRKAAEKVRITGQLIDTATGAHLWADRFDGQLDDIFALQDEITEKVVAATEPRLKIAEIELAARRRPDDFSAYDLYLRALPHHYSMTKDGLAVAIRLLSRALEIDPRFGSAASVAAWSHFQTIVQGWASDLKSESDETLRLSRLALAIDPNDPETLATVGRMTGYFTSDFKTAIDLINQSVALNPNLASSWSRRGWTYLSAGVNPKEAMLSFERFVRVSPRDPLLFVNLTGMAIALIELGRFDEAVEIANRALRQNQTYAYTYCCLAAALAQLGRQAEASEAAARLLELNRGFRISEFTGRFPGQIKSKQFVTGLRLAGLPE
jgi:adenylate cyclase